MFVLKCAFAVGVGFLLYSEMSCYARLLREDRMMRGEPYTTGNRILDWAIICFIVWLALLGLSSFMAQF